MVYVSYVVKEAMRLDGFTFNSFSNVALEDIEIDGMKIIKGTHLLYNFAAIHRHSDHWQ